MHKGKESRVTVPIHVSTRRLYALAEIQIMKDRARREQRERFKERLSIKRKGDWGELAKKQSQPA